MKKVLLLLAFWGLMMQGSSAQMMYENEMMPGYSTGGAASVNQMNKPCIPSMLNTQKPCPCPCPKPAQPTGAAVPVTPVFMCPTMPTGGAIPVSPSILVPQPQCVPSQQILIPVSPQPVGGAAPVIMEPAKGYW